MEILFICDEFDIFPGENCIEGKSLYLLIAIVKESIER